MDFVELIKLMLNDWSFSVGLIIGIIIGMIFMLGYKREEIREKREEIKELRDVKDKEIKELKKEIASLKISASAREFQL
ncbi:hypothetical protein [Helicobacter sp. WB40]|uniref:hypothetical protein n=1 Tax=Helicobacter sp. WB40 TaxID=3004130 RepID=UPI0022EBE7B5|nr:hypothetical protein [Helicobacter sp. WB40]MDA3967374.1 hypothetical protein [Helicobacter sp. WB40]